MEELSPEDRLAMRIAKKAQKRKNKLLGIPNTELQLINVNPKTINQNKIFKSYEAGKNLLLHGAPGTGKSFLAIYLMLKSIFVDQQFNNLTIVRSAVPTRSIGFLPGKETDKVEVYETPYQGIVANLFERDDAYKYLKTKGILKFYSTSYIRGETWDRSLIFVDEMQNMTFHELDSIITRLGEDCRIIFAGDMKQTDFRFEDEKEGLFEFMKIVKNMQYFDSIELGVNDIVRSGLVKEYLIWKMKTNNL